MIWEGGSRARALWKFEGRERGDGLGIGRGNKHVKLRVFRVTEGSQSAKKWRTKVQLGQG